VISGTPVTRSWSFCSGELISSCSHPLITRRSQEQRRTRMREREETIQSLISGSQTGESAQSTFPAQVLSPGSAHTKDQAWRSSRRK
jgi:hypothetical protein